MTPFNVCRGAINPLCIAYASLPASRFVRQSNPKNSCTGRSQSLSYTRSHFLPGRPPSQSHPPARPRKASTPPRRPAHPRKACTLGSDGTCLVPYSPSGAQALDSLSQSSGADPRALWATFRGRWPLGNKFFLNLKLWGSNVEAPRQASTRLPLISSFSLYLATVGAPGQVPGAELARLDSSVQEFVAIAHFVLNHGQLGFLEQASSIGACV